LSFVNVIEFALAGLPLFSELFAVFLLVVSVAVMEILKDRIKGGSG